MYEVQGCTTYISVLNSILIFYNSHGTSLRPWEWNHLPSHIPQGISLTSFFFFLLVGYKNHTKLISLGIEPETSTRTMTTMHHRKIPCTLQGPNEVTCSWMLKVELVILIKTSSDRKASPHPGRPGPELAPTRGHPHSIELGSKPPGPEVAPTRGRPGLEVAPHPQSPPIPQNGIETTRTSSRHHP
jgi:hypothetical protein